MWLVILLEKQMGTVIGISTPQLVVVRTDCLDSRFKVPIVDLIPRKSNKCTKVLTAAGLVRPIT